MASKSFMAGFSPCPCCRGKSGRERAEAKAELPDFLLCQGCEEASIAPPDMSIYTIPTKTGVTFLEASAAFAGLSEKEQLYAQALGAADWEGAKICLLQCSPESVPIFAMLQLVFHANSVEELVEKAKVAGLSEEEVEQALMYCAAFYDNIGNYKSFGDTKFVPELSPEKFYSFLTSGSADKEEIQKLWQECGLRMYSLMPRERQMGLGESQGLSTYFSSNCGPEDAEIASKFLESIKLSPYNTRLFKKDQAGKLVLVVLLASSKTEAEGDAIGALCKSYDFEGQSFEVVRGDYQPLMERIVENLRRAIPHTANPGQTAMLEKYVESFSLGSIEAHKDASRHWIKDVGPAVESYIGFIESYRDPSGARGEWEGFVACVNREVSKKFQVLVDQAEDLLTLMPWPKEFEKDKFLRPDFTSLDVLSFGTSGVPAGINIPNYDDIRQSEGFKNVSLGNVLQASYSSKGSAPPPTFLKAEDQELYKELQGPAFEVQVGIHELLGHGSGKLFFSKDGPFPSLTNPLTKSTIEGPFYADGATWDTVFGSVASAYEECRAECSGIYLCLEPAALAAFGHEAKPGELLDISYINWLHMARAGLLGLEFYTPETKQWRQAHMQARYCIMHVLLESGILKIEETKGEDGEPDLLMSLDRASITTQGKKAIGDFLLTLQVFKSTGDAVQGKAFFGKYSEVDESMLKLRGIVMARKLPRKLLVQPHMSIEQDGSVKLQNFPATPQGMIESFVARFPAKDEPLLELYRKEIAYHQYG